MCFCSPSLTSPEDSNEKRVTVYEFGKHGILSHSSGRDDLISVFDSSIASLYKHVNHEHQRRHTLFLLKADSLLRHDPGGTMIGRCNKVT